MTRKKIFLAMLPDAHLVGVADASAEAAEHFAEEYGVKAFSDYKSMLLDPEVDGEELSSTRDVSYGTANDPTKLSCEGHARQIGDLLSAIRGEGELSVDGKEGRKALEIIEKIYLSSQYGK